MQNRMVGNDCAGLKMFVERLLLARDWYLGNSLACVLSERFIKAVWLELWLLAIKALWVQGKRKIRSCIFKIGCGIF